MEISEKQYDNMVDEINRLMDSLVQAIKIIKLWHGPADWQAYLMTSQETEEIRKSLKLLRSNTVNELMYAKSDREIRNGH